MKRVVLLLAVVGAIVAEAPLPYHYDPPQPQLQPQPQIHHHHHHSHDQLNGFRPSHGYPCPDGIAHHGSEGRIINQHFETSGEPILAPQLPAIGNSDKQVTVNSQIAFGEHSQSHTEFVSAPTKAYIPPPPAPPIHQQLPHYSPPSHQYQQVNHNHNSGSIIHGIGKAPPPFNLHYQQAPIPIQQRPIPIPVPKLPAIRPQPQYIPSRPSFVQQNHFSQNQQHSHSHTVAVQGPSITDNFIPPPVGQAHGNFLEQNQFTSGAISGGHSGVISGGHSGSSHSSGFGGSNTLGGFTSSGSSAGFTSSGSSAGFASSGSSGGFASSGSLGGFTSSGSSAGFGSSGSLGGFTSAGSSGSSSNTLGFTSIGSTHNFNHPGLDEGLSQVISETFQNAGVGENVEKHIYVHVPPDDLEERGHQHVHQQLPAAQPKKHYKIIFIKAPNQQPSTNVYTQLAQQQQTEEKTLVYVLVKKPDEPTIQDIQQIQNTYKPSKPEVYFIKYKTHKENEGASQNVGNVDLTSGNFQGSDLNGGIDIRGGFSGDSNSIHDALATGIIEPRIPTGNVPSPVYGPPGHQK